MSHVRGEGTATWFVSSAQSRRILYITQEEARLGRQTLLWCGDDAANSVLAAWLFGCRDVGKVFHLGAEADDTPNSNVAGYVRRNVQFCGVAVAVYSSRPLVTLYITALWPLGGVIAWMLRTFDDPLTKMIRSIIIFDLLLFMAVVVPRAFDYFWIDRGLLTSHDEALVCTNLK